MFMQCGLRDVARSMCGKCVSYTEILKNEIDIIWKQKEYKYSDSIDAPI